MKAWKQFSCGIIAIVAYGFCAAPLQAQGESDDKPKPAARVLLPLPDLSGDEQDDDQGNQTMQPDHGPITGVQSATLGTSELRHSYWVPGVQYGNTVQSNAYSTTGSQNPAWTTTNYASGSLSLLEAWGHSQFGMNYSGGGFFSNDPGQGNGQYHQLSSAFEIDQRRSQILVIEQFSYLPQSAFGFGGNTGLAVPGITGALAVPLPSLQPQFVPGQSIFSAFGPRYSSTSAAQLTYLVTHRSSINVAVVYGLLRFIDSGNINNDTEILNVGYNYALTRRDSVGVLYRFTAFHYPGNPQAMGDQVAQFIYARRITGRLALDLGVGPEITSFRLPVNGIKQTISSGGAASLSYAFSKSFARLTFSHGVGSGSGIFTGSSTNELMATWGRPLSRAWVASLNVGYARDSSIVALQGLSSPSSSSWLAGAGLNRPLGRAATLAIGYQAQIQVSNGLLCGPSGCNTTQVTHQIQTSLQWHAPAQVLR